MKKIVFNKLKKGNILRPEFESLSENNQLDFQNHNNVILYAPNGTGKTTFANILRGDDNCELNIQIDDEHIDSKEAINKRIHVISDQISRHVIEGATDEYILGENIALERKKKAEYERELEQFIENIQNLLKNEFGITKTTACFYNIISDDTFKEIIKTLAKKGAKITDINIPEMFGCFKILQNQDTSTFDEQKLNFLKNDLSDKIKDSLTETIINFKIEKLVKNENVKIIDENLDSIPILQKYKHINRCIVCETENIEPENLIKLKTKKEETVKAALNEKEKDLLERITKKLQGDDPFSIRTIIFNLIETEDLTVFDQLKKELELYKTGLYKSLCNRVKELFEKSSLEKLYKEYSDMLSKKLELKAEDELLIKDIIANNIGKEVELIRDSEKNIIIKLNNKSILGTELVNLELSTGETNFLSLSFELLKAKHVSQDIVLIDDPISSFDSIYKNKIVYCILKILDKKSKILLTHNLDMVRLLDCQLTNCFNLYLLSNDDAYGFISVEKEEKELLLYFDKLLDLLRSNEIETEIIDKRNYILSLVPFMRALIKILGVKEPGIGYKQKLTNIMHGYSNEIEDLIPIYNFIFNKSEIGTMMIGVNDILSLNLDSIQIMKTEKYPLLEKTLRHTLTYLFLRLKVEKSLCDKFPAETRNCELLGEIINKALKHSKYMQLRAKLSSEKTLLNEFNHYEGNFNLFQPAIDITESKLKKETKEILDIITQIGTM